MDFLLVKTDQSGVVPEFPAAFVLALLMAVTTIAVVASKKAPAHFKGKI